MIRKAEYADVNGIVELHLASLQDGLLFLLGKFFLTLFYKEVISDTQCFVFLYFDNNKITGVAASSVDAESVFSRFKKKYFIKLFFAFLRISVSHPLLLFKIFFSGTYPAFPKEELMMLFVDKNCRGKGVGIQLVSETVKEFKRRNAKSFKISILFKNSTGREFYEKFGFNAIRSFFYFKEKRVLYVYEIID